jgi:hypothetical protein
VHAGSIPAVASKQNKHLGRQGKGARIQVLDTSVFGYAAADDSGRPWRSGVVADSQQAKLSGWRAGLIRTKQSSALPNVTPAPRSTPAPPRKSGSAIRRVAARRWRRSHTPGPALACRDENRPVVVAKIKGPGIFPAPLSLSQSRIHSTLPILSRKSVHSGWSVLSAVTVHSRFSAPDQHFAGNCPGARTIMPRLSRGPSRTARVSLRPARRCRKIYL